MVEKCDSCHVGLRLKDTRKRRLVEAVPVIAKTVIYHCPGPGARNAKNYFLHLFHLCQRISTATLSSHRLPFFIQAAILHYIHRMTIGKCLEIFGPQVNSGALIDCFHRLGKIAEKAKTPLIAEYRKSTARHADETGWRTDGHSGYAWLFGTSMISIFEFRDTRSSRVAREILGEEKIKGCFKR